MPQQDQQSERHDTLFAMYDTDGDGVISRQDYDVMAQRVLKAFDHSPTSPKGKKLQAQYEQAWEIMSVADTDEDGKITRDEFRAAMADYAQKDLFDETSRNITAAEFAAADTDDDGILGRAEFTRLATAFGYRAEDAEAAFTHLDQDNDGRISHEEYYQGWQQYVTSAIPLLVAARSSDSPSAVHTLPGATY